MSSSETPNCHHAETIESTITIDDDKSDQTRAQLDKRLVLIYNVNNDIDLSLNSSFDIDCDRTPTALNQAFHYELNRPTIEIMTAPTSIEAIVTTASTSCNTNTNSIQSNSCLASQTTLNNQQHHKNNGINANESLSSNHRSSVAGIGSNSTNYINVNQPRTVIADAINTRSATPPRTSSIDVTKLIFNNNIDRSNHNHNDDHDHDLVSAVTEVREEEHALMNSPDAMFELNDLHATSTSNMIGQHHQTYHGKHLNYYSTDLSSTYGLHPTLYADSALTFGSDVISYNSTSSACAMGSSQDLLMHGYETLNGTPVSATASPSSPSPSLSSSTACVSTGATLATLCPSAPPGPLPVEYHNTNESSSFVDHCFTPSSSLDSCHRSSLVTLDNYMIDNSCQHYYQQSQQQQQQSQSQPPLAPPPQYHHLQPQQQSQSTHSMGLSASLTSSSCINSDLLNASFTSQQSTTSTSSNSTLLDPGTLSSNNPKMTMMQSTTVARCGSNNSTNLLSVSMASSTSSITTTTSAASSVDQTQHLVDHHSAFTRSDGGSSIQSDCSHTHEDYHPYTCQWFDCYLSFIDMHEFVKHLEEVHVNSTSESKHKYYCAWQNCRRADQPFNARYKLLIHMRVHSGEKPYPCEQDSCRKSFSRLENLKIHNRSHTGEKPYSCKYDGCNKAFTNSSDRIKHHKTHVDAKPYACAHTNCTKRYTDPSSLRKHLKVHRAKVNNGNSSSNNRQTADDLLKSSNESLRVSNTDQALSYSWTGESFVKRIYENDNNNNANYKNHWLESALTTRLENSNDLNNIYDCNNNNSRLANSFTSGCAPMLYSDNKNYDQMNHHHRRASMFELPSVPLQNNRSSFVLPTNVKGVENSSNSVRHESLQEDGLF